MSRYLNLSLSEYMFNYICSTDYICSTFTDTIYCGVTLFGMGTKVSIQYYYLNITQNDTSVFLDTCGSDPNQPQIQNLRLYDKGWHLLSYDFEDGYCPLAQSFIWFLDIAQYILQITFDVETHREWQIQVLCGENAVFSTNISITIANNTDDWNNCGQIIIICSQFGFDACLDPVNNHYLSRNTEYLRFDIEAVLDNKHALVLGLYDSNGSVLFWYDDAILFSIGYQLLITVGPLPSEQYTLQITTFRKQSVQWELQALCCSESSYRAIYTDIVPVFLSAAGQWSDIGLTCEYLYGTTFATIITKEDWYCALQGSFSFYEGIGDSIYHKASLDPILIGMHRDIISQNEWYWLDGTPCDYTSTTRCKDDIHWNDASVDLAGEQMISYLLPSRMEINALNSRDLESDFGIKFDVLCSTPNSKYQLTADINHCVDKTSCWLKTDCCNDSTLIDDTGLDVALFAPPIAYWNGTLFVVGFTQIHYSQFNLFQANNWSHIMYNNIDFSLYLDFTQYIETLLRNNYYAEKPPQYAQYFSSLYVFAWHAWDQYIDTCDHCVFRVDLNDPTAENIEFYTVSGLLELGNICMVANDNYIYIVTNIAVIVYNLKGNSSWITKPFYSSSYSSDAPIACSMDKNYEIIYMFTDIASILLYDTNSNNIEVLDVPQFSEYPVLQVLTGMDNKLYIPGYSVSWKTMVFDLESQQFQTGTIDIDFPTTKHVPYYRSSQLTVFDDNILLLSHTTDPLYPRYDSDKTSSISIYYTVTNLILINFTQTMSTNRVWPSDGFTINYYLNDFTNSMDGMYNICFKSQYINVSITLNTSNDHCVCNSYKYILCHDCYQQYYISSINSAVTQLQFVPAHNYDIDILILPNIITINLQRCNIWFYSDKTTNNYDPSISFSFNLSNNCYSRKGEIFVVNIDIPSLYISKQLLININNEGTALCKISHLSAKNSKDDREDYCYSTQYKFALHYDPKHVEVGEHEIRFESNMIDIRVIPSTESITYSSSTSKNNNTLWYLLLLLIIPIIVIIVVYIDSKRKYMDAFVVNKSLVLIIGIAQFEERKNMLDGVRRNVADLKKLWRHNYKYDVFVCNEEQLYSTKDNIIDFIDEHKIKLEHNRYQAVIVHIISHGMDDGDSFWSSDQRRYNLEDMRRELTDFAKGLMDAPLIKIIFNHICRGQNNYSVGKIRGGIPFCGDTAKDQRHDKNKWENSNWAVIWGNVKDRVLSDDGAFTDCICDAFEGNLRRMRKKCFRTLITEIGIDLEQKTYAAEICNMNETLRETIIRFEPFPSKKELQNEMNMNYVELQEIDHV